MINLVNDGRVDLALTLEPKPEEKLVFDPVFEDEMVFLTSPRHEWAEAGSVQRRDIPRQNYVLYPRNSYTFRLVDDYFRRDRLVLNTFVELGSMEAIKNWAAQPGGQHRRPDRPEELQAGSPWRCRWAGMRRQWGIVRRSWTFNLAEETFVRLCRDATPDHPRHRLLVWRGKRKRRRNSWLAFPPQEGDSGDCRARWRSEDMKQAEHPGDADARAGHWTHQCPGDVMTLITASIARISGPVNRNFTACRVLHGSDFAGALGCRSRRCCIRPLIGSAVSDFDTIGGSEWGLNYASGRIDKRSGALSGSNLILDRRAFRRFVGVRCGRGRTHGNQ
jgi:hypothetical protein